MQQIAEVAGRNWLDSWPETIKERVKGKANHS